MPDDRYPALALTPQQQKQHTLDALLALLVARAAQEPLLLIVEDLHWVDPSTLEFLSLLVEQGPTARILTLCTFRPHFTPPWPLWGTSPSSPSPACPAHRWGGWSPP